jgi:hypothetical protein
VSPVAVKYFTARCSYFTARWSIDLKLGAQIAKFAKLGKPRKKTLNC